MNLGDFLEDTTNIGFLFTSRDTTGEASPLSSGLVDIYKISSTTPTTVGVTITSTFAGVVGLNRIQVNANSTTFYVVAEEYSVILSQGTVNSVDVSGEVLAHFSIENRGVKEKVVDGLSTHGVSVHTSTDVFEQAKNAFTTMGYTTSLATDLSSAVTVTTTDIFDEAKNAISTNALDQLFVSTASTNNIVAGSFAGLVTSTAGNFATFDESSASLTAIRKQNDADWSSAITSTDVFEQAKNALTTAGMSTVTAIMTAAQTQAYSTATNPSAANMLFGIQQMLMNFSINSTILTVYNIGTTSSTAMTFEINDSTAPTAIKRTG